MSAQASTTTRTKVCPYCAEAIRYEAVKCRFCGSDLPTRPPETIRSIASSPLLAVAAALGGALAALTESLKLADKLGGENTSASLLNFLVLGDTHEQGSAGEGSFGFDPSEAVSNNDRIAVLIAAIAIGALGFAAALVARRRPRTAMFLFFGAGTAGLVTSLVAGVNLVLVALSVLLIVAAIAAALSLRSFELAREKSG